MANFEKKECLQNGIIDDSQFIREAVTLSV